MNNIIHKILEEYQPPRNIAANTSPKYYNSAGDLANTSPNNYHNFQEANSHFVSQPPEMNALRKSNSISNLNQFNNNNNNNKQIILSNRNNFSSYQQLNKTYNNNNNNNNYGYNNDSEAEVAVKPRTALIEQKRREWIKEKEKVSDGADWPFGKPGPGAGPRGPPPESRTAVNKTGRKYVDKLKEYKEINDQLEAIAEAERRLKQEQQLQLHQLGETRRPLNASLNFNQSEAVAPAVYHDQSKVPAAMRTSLMFGVSFYLSLLVNFFFFLY